VRLAWIEAEDGVTRGYHRQSARPVAEVRHNGRPAPLNQDRWIVIVEGTEVGSSHHPRLARELAEDHYAARLREQRRRGR
jgi:hypothetical protein